ncbi:hypothetical protein MMC10_001242 [Thelotrema lepadinum]|nr:hypothetical protein [Thelotrema lepadinum]
MKLPYSPPTPPPTATQSTKEIYARISARRSPRPLLPLDLALLHSPPVADGWNSFLGSIRSQTILSPALLELAVCRVAVLNGAGFEWKGHMPLARKAGVSGGVLGLVRDVDAGGFEGERDGGKEGGGKGGGEIGEVERAVLAYTDEMTRNVKVGEGVVERLRELLGGEREVVELTVAVAAYNCVSRFLVALDVGEMNEVKVEEWGVGD